MQSWIFQGNPKVFDIDGYLRDRKFISWSLRQKHYINRINIGDEIYLWRADAGRTGSGGIIARAMVIGPCVIRTDEDAVSYWYTEDWKSPGIGVPLEVLEVKSEEDIIKRQYLKEHPLLKDLLILRMSNMTNYYLTDVQAFEMRKIWGEPFSDFSDEAEEALTFPEGRKAFKLHRTIERNPNLIRSVKNKEKEKNGLLKCKICGFCFYDKYGDIGIDYIEGHHLMPLSEVDDKHLSKEEDIILVCSNCHRMLHRKRPWLTIDKLSSLIKS